MIIDKFLQVSDGQDVTVSAPSADVIDFGQKNPNTGMDDRSKMVVTVGNDVTAGGAATVTFVVQDSADNITFTDVAANGPVGKDDLKAGRQVVISMPTKLRRYCRVNYVVVSGPLTAGKFSAQIVMGIGQNDPYPQSPNIA